jgi:hypothetical protein
MYLPLIYSLVFLVLPEPFNPAKLFFPEGFFPQADSKAN